MRAPFSLGVFLLFLSCGQKPGHVELDLRHNRTGEGPKVATFGDDSISAPQLKQRLLELNPYERARYQEPSLRKEFVQGLARFEVLAAEAQRRGLAQDPEVALAAKKVMVQRLLQQELDERPTPVSDEAVQAYYDKRKGDYVKPEMIRLSLLSLLAPAQAPERESKRAKAQTLLEQARALAPLDYQGFAALVRQHSEDPKTKPLDGDTRFLSLEELAQQFGAPIAEKAKALQQVGQLAEEVVETDAGLHLLKLQGRQAALNLTVDQVKSQIQNTLIQEQRMAAYQKLLDAAESRFQLTIDQAAVEKLEVDFKAPKADGKSPPGYVPPPNAEPAHHH